MDREGEREQLSAGEGDDSAREATSGDVCPPPHSQPHTDTWKSKPVVRPPLLLADANGAVPTGTDARCRVRSSTRVQEACRLMCGRQRYSARLSETRPAPARNRPPGTMIPSMQPASEGENWCPRSAQQQRGGCTAWKGSIGGFPRMCGDTHHARP